ncbi:hypothetical protein BD779DRAFT_1534859, partial [Infundibulicybe gibba]
MVALPTSMLSLRLSGVTHDPEKPRKRFQSLLRNVQKIKAALLALTHRPTKYASAALHRVQHNGYSNISFDEKSAIQDTAHVVGDPPTDPSHDISAILRELYSFPGSGGQPHNDRSLELINLLEPLFPLLPGSDNGTYSHLYKRLLELSRYGSGQTPQMALRLLLMQVGTGNSQTLSKVIAQRCSSNVRHILVLVIGFLRDSCTLTLRGPLRFIWNQHGFPAEHSLAPFIRFINQIAQHRRGAAKAVIEAGFLDLLECMCLSNFLDPRIPTADTSNWLANTPLITTCILTLSTLMNRCGDHTTLVTKLRTLPEIWPTSRLHDLTQIAPTVIPLAMDNRSAVELRQDTKQPPSVYLCDLCIELLQPSSKFHPSDAADSMVPKFLACLSSSVNEPDAWADLQTTLLQAPYHLVVNLLFNIIKYLVRPFPSSDKVKQIVQPFMDFTNILTQTRVIPRVALVEAGVFSLKYPYSLMDSQEYWSRFAYLSPIPPYARNSTLLDLERSPLPHHS